MPRISRLRCCVQPHIFSQIGSGHQDQIIAFRTTCYMKSLVACLNLSAVDNGPVKIRLQIRWKQSLLKPWLLNLMHGQKLLNLSKKQSADIQNQTVSSMVWSNSAEFGLSQLCGPEPRNIAKAHLP